MSMVSGICGVERCPNVITRCESEVGNSIFSSDKILFIECPFSETNKNVWEKFYVLVYTSHIHPLTKQCFR